MLKDIIYRNANFAKANFVQKSTYDFFPYKFKDDLEISVYKHQGENKTLVHHSQIGAS